MASLSAARGAKAAERAEAAASLRSTAAALASRADEQAALAVAAPGALPPTCRLAARGEAGYSADFALPPPVRPPRPVQPGDPSSAILHQLFALQHAAVAEAPRGSLPLLSAPPPDNVCVPSPLSSETADADTPQPHARAVASGETAMRRALAAAAAATLDARLSSDLACEAAVFPDDHPDASAARALHRAIQAGMDAERRARGDAGGEGGSGEAGANAGGGTSTFADAGGSRDCARVFGAAWLRRARLLHVASLAATLRVPPDVPPPPPPPPQGGDALVAPPPPLPLLPCLLSELRHCGATLRWHAALADAAASLRATSFPAARLSQLPHDPASPTVATWHLTPCDVLPAVVAVLRGEALFLEGAASSSPGEDAFLAAQLLAHHRLLRRDGSLIDVSNAPLAVAVAAAASAADWLRSAVAASPGDHGESAPAQSFEPRTSNGGVHADPSPAAAASHDDLAGRLRVSRGPLAVEFVVGNGALQRGGDGDGCDGDESGVADGVVVRLLRDGVPDPSWPPSGVEALAAWLRKG